MALSPTFTSRVNTSVVQRAPRRISGSGLAEGLGLLGRAVGDAGERDRQAGEAEADAAFRVAQEEQRRERSRRAMAFGAQLSEARIEYAKRAEEARSQLDPGAPGWEGRAREIASEVFAPLQSLYADDEELAAHLAPQLQTVASGIIANEVGWEAQQRTAWEGEQFKVTLQAEADLVLGDPDPAKAAEALERVETMIDLSDYDGTTKGKLRILARQTLMGSALADGLAQAGRWDELQALVSDPATAGLWGDDKGNYLRTVEAGRTADAREAELAASAEREAAQTALDTLKVRIDNFDYPTQSEITTAFNAAKAAGVPTDKLAEFAFLGERSVNARQLQGLTDGSLQAEVEGLRAQQSAGRLDDAGRRRLREAERQLDGRDGEKGDSLRTLWSSGPEGQRQAVAQLAAMGDDAQAWRAAARAGNTRMAVYARLGPDGQREAIEGRGLRETQGRGDEFLPTGTNGKGDKVRARQRFRAVVGEDLWRQLGAGVDDVFETALDVMAGTGGKWDEANFDRAVRVVFGASRRSDGTLQGGIGRVRGRTVELPDNLNAAEFDGALSRSDFAGAHYASGQPASKADILAHFLPVPVGRLGADGRTLYTLVDAQGHPLLDSKLNGPYQFYVFPTGSR